MRETPDLWHKYTDDYELITVTDEKGREKKEARYTGPWFCVMGTPQAVRIKLFLSLACGILVTGLLIMVQLSTHASSWAFYVTVPQTVALFPLLYLLMGFMNLPYNLKPMERAFYMHGIIRVCRSCVAIMALVGVSFAGVFIYRAIAKDWYYRPEDVRYLILLGAILILCGGVLILLNSIDISQRPNHAVSTKKQ